MKQPSSMRERRNAGATRSRSGRTARLSARNRPPGRKRIRGFLIFTGTGLLILLAAVPRTAHAEIRGYLKNLNAVVEIPESPAWLLTGMVHHRVDAAWRPVSGLEAGLGVRSRLIYGNLVPLIPGYSRLLEKDPGYWRWSRVLADDRSSILHGVIDRAYADYTTGAWQVRLGRQRINWGMNLVWNPNDLFNSYSYLDFDYEERPGRDAVGVTRYTGAASFLQAVYQPSRRTGESVVAGLFRWNRWGYDAQVLAGRWARDWVAGAGWSGQAGGGAFRGEWAWFHPAEGKDGRDVWVTSVSGDYTLRNGLYGQVSLLYNSAGRTDAAGSIDLFGERLLTAKTLTRGRMNLFAQLRYPVTPLVTADAAAIHNPCDRSWYLAPSLSFSLGNNVEFLVIGQFLAGDAGAEFGGDAKVFYTRLKWSY